MPFDLSNKQALDGSHRSRWVPTHGPGLDVDAYRFTGPKGQLDEGRA